MIEELALDELTQGGVVLFDDFELVKQIGRGATATVYKAIHKPSQSICALKQLSYDGTTLSSSFKTEVSILARCRSLFLARLIGFTLHHPICIITPYFPKGSLFNYVCYASPYPLLTSTNKTIIAMGVAYALKKLHMAGIIHRDIKSSNILLDDHFLPFVSDFGVSRMLTSDPMTPFTGTINWMAPEVINGSEYTPKVDVYSYGMVLYEILCKKQPFQGLSYTDIIQEVCMNHARPRLPKGGNKSIKRLIKLCWSEDPEDRPSFRRIFDAFKKGNIMFDGCEPQGIEAVLNLIEQSESQLLG